MRRINYRMLCILLACGLFTLGPVKAQDEKANDIMTPEILWSFGRIGDMQVSPNGEHVAYGVSYYSVKENKSSRDIYVKNLSGDVKQITHTPENEFGIQWRPDGKKIGYLSSKSGSLQMWEMDPNGSGNTQVTKIDGGIQGFKYSPDMKNILFIKAVKLDATVQDLYPDLPLANARLETDIMYRHWDQWHDFTYNHIFVAPYTTGTIGAAKDIMPDQRYDAPLKPFGGLEEINWNTTSDAIAYTSKKSVGKEYAMSTNSDIYLYNINDKTTKNLTEGMMGYDKCPIFSPDGKYIAWSSMERDGYEADKNRLFIMNLKNGKKKDLTGLWDQSIHGLVWASNSKSLYGISDVQATDEIYEVSIKRNNIRRVTNGVHNYQSVQVAKDALIAQKVSMSSPAELYRVDMESGQDVAVTHVTKPVMDKIKMGKVEKRWVNTTDGKKELVWVIYPPHFDPNKKYPALLYCQGGPQGTVSQFWSYRWNFQMMAANDYIVVAPNRRGLPGFGQEWCEEISKDYGGQCMDDYISAIDSIAKLPFVDENNIGAVGASFGGYSVYYLAGHNQNKRFNAFISHCGIFNFDQMYSTTEEMFFVNWDIGGAYWDKNNAAAQKSYKDFSPHKFVDNWNTPILVVHGAKDFRIPYTQGMGAFNTAIMKGVPAEFLYFPEENHWVLRPQNGILWQRVFFNFLDKNLKK
ncbi:S9 family peptidase [Halosquirtibacter xylanolyticus]|uniref:S9 family peptidase n=1 Tax=Halosquirtibacter xylanolyticus TaxID=3374599 RepID=UPI003748B3CC|nr:S9 family peptidase [Prolixibacteraceae bacterium]